MRKFRDLDKRAMVENTVSNTMLDTIHQNTISEVRLYSNVDGKQRNSDLISTVGVDGQMVIWDLKVKGIDFVEFASNLFSNTNRHWKLRLAI